MLAPTGVDAHNINGETIHRCFGIPVGSNEQLPKLIGKNLQNMQSSLAEVDCFIVDEMSMAEQRLFAAIDKRLRQVFPQNATADLTGKALTLVGDFGQLQPVGDVPIYSTSGKSASRQLASAIYHQFDQIVILQEVVRQSADTQFRDLILRIRDAKTTTDDFKILSLQFMGNIANNNEVEFTDAMQIFTKLNDTHHYNHKKLHEMGRPYAKILAKHTGGANAISASSDEAGGLSAELFWA